MAKLRQIAFYGKGGIGKSTTSQNTLVAPAAGSHLPLGSADATRKPVGTVTWNPVIGAERSFGTSSSSLDDLDA